MRITLHYFLFLNLIETMAESVSLLRTFIVEPKICQSAEIYPQFEYSKL